MILVKGTRGALAAGIASSASIKRAVASSSEAAVEDPVASVEVEATESRDDVAAVLVDWCRW